MSDTTPIYPAATAPPSYTESEAQPQAPTRAAEPKPQTSALPKDPPPPYYPPQQASSVGSYQRFDNTGDQRVEVVTVIELGPQSVYLQCPSCGNFVYTEIVHRAGALTFIASAFCFLFCMVCTCLPCFISSCLDVDHYCPRCNNFFGTFTRL